MLSCYPGFWASAAWVLWCYCIMSALMLRNFTWVGYNLRLCDICENNVPALLQMVNSLLNYDSLESSRVCQTNGLLFFEYKSGGISPPSTRESWALFWESSRKSLLKMGLCLSVCLTYYVSDESARIIPFEKFWPQSVPYSGGKLEARGVFEWTRNNPNEMEF